MLPYIIWHISSFLAIMGTWNMHENAFEEGEPSFRHKYEINMMFLLHTVWIMTNMGQNLSFHETGMEKVWEQLAQGTQTAMLLTLMELI